MIFDSKETFDIDSARQRLDWIIKKGKRFEIIVKNPRRSISQNSYLHLCLTWFANEYGETVEYIKQDFFKKQVNSDIFKTEFVNQKTGEIRDAWKSTSELDTAQLTRAIERFRNFASKEAGIYLPEPGDLNAINAMERELSRI